MKNTCFLLFGMLLSCNSILVFTDHDSSIDFSKYKTYAYFKPGIDKVKISDLDKRRILKAIDIQMYDKSLMKSDIPDLLVSLNTSAKDKIYINNINSGFGVGVGTHGFGVQIIIQLVLKLKEFCILI